MEKQAILRNADFGTFVEKLSQQFDVYFPVKKNEQRFFKKYASSDFQAVVGEVRAFEPLKAFFSRARECVAQDFSSEVPSPNHKPFAIIGAKACDLKGMKIQDFVFNDHDYKDPFYIAAREKNLIISADCTCAIDTCFCLALGVKPHPSDDFDLNLSSMADGFLVEAGSAKGQKIVNEFSSLFIPSDERHIKERDDQRVRVAREVENNLKKFDVPNQDNFKGIFEQNSTAIWEDEAKTCVECGACTNICPTCHCFLLYDQQKNEQLARFRIWDSCLIRDYAKVAGGGNPRKKLWMRLRNRFEKKFDFFPKLMNMYACTGCGRCISACPAKIDIRRVLRRLVQLVGNSKAV
ncbi:MAG: 4Fe-4S dicluster domain-containing protein [Elusimicrobia bacterium]|nr:4Fe-4S dicluster domain-containing protein [Candidatus Obscuribacterium magneticum]